MDKEVNTFFLSLIELSDGTVGTITQCLQDCLVENGVALSDFVGLGSDGASVMTGTHSGVSTLNTAQTSSTHSTLCTLCN